jgi:UDP-3-O-[3-hydroxymyristoyl] glucosamine N-acyltransferase
VIDPRFYTQSWTPTATDIAELLGKSVRGDGATRLTSFASAERAGPTDLTFIDAADATLAGSIAAGVCLTTEAIASLLPLSHTTIITPHPRAAFGRVAQRMATLREHGAGPAIDPAARIDTDVVLETGCVIGADAHIGKGARIGANTVIGPGVQIGERTRIGANAVVRCALIGDGVTILSGAIIGESGFGLAPAAGGAVLTPHFGRVIIQNGASVGANACVDRGLLDDTVLGESVHIDNLSHIGHNTRVGSHTVMAAFAGVSGSVDIGEGVQFGGRVGVRDHVTIGKGARIAAGTALLDSVPAGETWAGFPAKPLKTWMRELAWLARAAQKRSSDK